MSLAYLVAMKSKDESTKVGTVIVDDENEILATGYNGFPRGFDDDVAERKVKPLKLVYTVHSELNACLSAARKNISLKGSRAYVTWAPCSKCALALVQSGVKEVIIHKENPVRPSWVEEVQLGADILAEGGVTLREWSGEIAVPVIFKGGDVHTHSSVDCCTK